MNKGIRAFHTLIMFLIMLTLLCAVCLITFTVYRLASGKDAAVIASSSESGASDDNAGPIIVIDAGHGGMDGGAVGIDGSLEKEINLEVAKKLEALCRLSGIDCLMTRNEDCMLVPDDVKDHRKMHDLKNRLKAADELHESGRDVIFVSIHMNNFTSSKYSGLQVWYSPNHELGASLASYVQKYAGTFLDPDNKRETKRSTSAIFILDRIELPAVLIECGFLSNPDECALLGTDEYRSKLAVTIFSALCEFLNQEIF